MRPEQFSSGNRTGCMLFNIDILASMRPEQFSSGNPHPPKAMVHRQIRFNEAGAIQLRKSAHYGLTCPVWIELQ